MRKPKKHFVPEGATPVVGVIGAGSWGTALAVTLSRKGYIIKIWDRRQIGRASCRERV